MSEIILIFSAAAVPIVGIAVFIFIVGQSAFNAAYSGLKSKTIIFKALAALAIWLAASYGMLQLIGESLVSPLGFTSETPPGWFEKYSAYLLFAGLVIYIFTGIGLGFLVKGQAKRRPSSRAQ